MDRVRNILKRLLRVYAHIYCQHFQSLQSYELNDQFEFSVIHFIYFVDQFKLVSAYDMRPLADLAMEKAPNLPSKIHLPLSPTVTKEMIVLLKQHEESRLCSASNLSSVSSGVKVAHPSPNVLFGEIASEPTTERRSMYTESIPNGNGKPNSGKDDLRVFL